MIAFFHVYTYISNVYLTGILLFCSSNGFVVDDWEVVADKVLLDGELGEGAFGKVFKGTLYELPQDARKSSAIGSTIRRKNLKMKKGYEIAIKVLQGRLNT